MSEFEQSPSGQLRMTQLDQQICKFENMFYGVGSQTHQEVVGERTDFLLNLVSEHRLNS
jgi:hypothetical protein